MIICRTIFSLALIALVLGGWSPAAQTSESASRFVQQLGEQAINVLQDDSISLAQREMQFRALLIEGFDLNLIGRFVLGRARKTADDSAPPAWTRARNRCSTPKKACPNFPLSPSANRTISAPALDKGERSMVIPPVGREESRPRCGLG